MCYINVPVESQSKHHKFGCEIIKENDDVTKFYTGLATWSVFHFLFTYLVTYFPIKRPSLMKLQLCDSLLMVLMRLRLNLLVEDLVYQFEISLSTASDLFQEWMDVMFDHLRTFIKSPTQEIVPTSIYASRARCIIDCSDIFIEGLSSFQPRAKTYSNYKKHNTVKFVIGITPSGAISFSSKCWGGRATDKCITQNIEYKAVILADRGFAISDDLGLYCARLEIAAFTQGKKWVSRKSNTRGDWPKFQSTCTYALNWLLACWRTTTQYFKVSCLSIRSDAKWDWIC